MDEGARLHAELLALRRNDPAGAIALYRKVKRAALLDTAWINTLLRLQDDRAELTALIAAELKRSE